MKSFQILQRERDAVRDWENEIKAGKEFLFHGMKDHPLHPHTLLLAGMWGALNLKNMKLMKKIRMDIINDAQENDNGARHYDQELLTTHLGPYADKILFHNSYGCG